MSRLCRHNIVSIGSATNVVVLPGPGAVVSRHFHGTSRGFLPPLGELWRVSLHDFDYKTQSQSLYKVAEITNFLIAIFIKKIIAIKTQQNMRRSLKKSLPTP